MAWTGTFLTLAVSVLLTSYLFYALIPVPAEIEQGDDVFWIFAKRKCTRALSTIGEYLGLGHRTNLTRYLASTALFTLASQANYQGVEVSYAVFDGVPVRICKPVNQVGNSPALFWIHGGGWVTGSAEADEFFTVELSRRLQIPVISVNYRLAPEHVYPASFADCYAAVKYLMDKAKLYGLDSKRIAVGGASAGGNLAAAAALKLRDVKHPVQPALQILLVPCLQAFDFNTPSYQQNADNGFLPRYWMVNFWLWYAYGRNGHHRNYEYIENQHTSADAKVSESAKYVDHSLLSRKYVHSAYVPNEVNFGNESLWNEIKDVFLDPYFAPLMAQDLTGLPPAYIVTAGWDVLRDDGLMYAKRLAASGVDVESAHYQSAYHHIFIQFDHFEISKKILNELVQFLASRI